MDKRTKIIILLALLVLGGGILLASRAMQRQTTSQIPANRVKQLHPTSEIESVRDLIDGEYEFQPVDTSDWKTYRNEEMGFEVKIPKEWEIGMENADNICAGFSFGEKNKVYVSEGMEIYPILVYICDNKKSLTTTEESLLNWKKTYNISIWEFFLDNVPAYYFNGFGEGAEIPQMPNKDYSISITSVLCLEKECGYPEVRSILHGIIKNFKFIR